MNEAKPAKSWKEIKAAGADHYKHGDVEPIDLYRAEGILVPFAICNIIKYAYRQGRRTSLSDCDKIIHYAEMLKYLAREEADGQP